MKSSVIASCASSESQSASLQLIQLSKQLEKNGVKLSYANGQLTATGHESGVKVAQFAATLIPDASGDFAGEVLAAFTQPIDPDTLDFERQGDFKRAFELYEEANDENTLAIRAFNDAIASDDRVESVMLAISDGLSFLRVR